MRIGLIGAGAVAPFHMNAARSLAGAAMTAVCDLDEGAARRASALAPGARIFTDHRRMLDEDVVDAVIVNTPHALHLPITVDAARAGKHVLVEKPMATTLEDCDLMASACRDAGVALAVGHIQHFLPDKVAANRLIASGELGDVLMIRDNRSTDYRPGTRSPWFFDREIAGGGALFNIGAHCLDRSLRFGGARASQISAAVAHRFGSPVETDGVLRLQLENGVEVAISIVSDPPTRGDLLTVVCERGTVEADPRAGASVRIDGATRILHTPAADDIQTGFTAQLADFLDVIDGAEPAVPIAHARHVVELILAGYRSARTSTTSAPLPVPAAS